MAKARLYGWNGEFPDKTPGGQKAIVFRVLKNAPEEMWTGKEWTEIVGTELKTTQDPYRVVLYYILILKAEGCIRTVEREIDAVTKTLDATRHAVTVYQTPSTKDHGELPEVREEMSNIDRGLAACQELMAE